ncbi:MAG: hypothetical protein J6T70_14300, partial [Bacteroidales bacterium]|nr:hypothetical protein [Bacteroidales bacterium]
QNRGCKQVINNVLQYSVLIIKYLKKINFFFKTKTLIITPIKQNKKKGVKIDFFFSKILPNFTAKFNGLSVQGKNKIF